MFNNEGYNLSDLAAVTRGADGMGGNTGAWWIIILFLFMFMGWGSNGYGRNTGELNQYATAASQQEILFGQQFQGLGSKIDKIGDGICSSTYALNNAITTAATNVGGTVTNEGRAIQMQLAECCCGNKEATQQVRFDMANYNAATAAAIHAEGEQTRAMLQQNKIESMQSQINQLQLQSALCGVVRYPNATTYSAGYTPFYNANYCGCNG